MAKFLIVYSSKTGNTKKVAEALYRAAPEGSVLARVEEMPNASDFDAVFVGYWMDRGGADEKAKNYLRTLQGKKIVLFETMGADPTSEHAYTGFANASTALSEGNTVLGVLAFQGAIDPKLVEAMRHMGAGNPHNSPHMEKVVQEASTHPDEADLTRAEDYMKQFTARYERFFGKK